MLQASEVKIGTNKNAPRVWLEGGRTEHAGFKPGERFKCIKNEDERRLTLVLDSEGSRIVSRKGDKPVIDLNSSEVLGMFVGLERLRVVIGNGVIHLLPMAVDKRIADRITRLRNNLATGRLAVGSMFHGGVRTSLLLAV